MDCKTNKFEPVNPVRVITATALFDGHDAAINIMRRILIDFGAEVIHLGHNRSVAEIVDAAIEEDVQGIAVSSYQGGHMEFFTYMREMLDSRDAGHIRIFGGGGGVIVPDEIRKLESSGITKIYSPEDGAAMGLTGMIDHMLSFMNFSTVDIGCASVDILSPDNPGAIGRMITMVEQVKAGDGRQIEDLMGNILKQVPVDPAPVVGITGTGGAGKSSLTDEIILRLLADLPDIHIGVICCDPSRRRTGGALLGDRIRMNSMDSDRVYLRSMAVRRTSFELPAVLPHAVAILKAAGMDLIIVETAGIGQGASNILDLADVSIYVMTGEYGAASQLEKIDMLDYADIVVVNKFDKQGSEDAFRDIAKQVQRNHKAFDEPLGKIPVFGTIAARFNDDGVTAMYRYLVNTITGKTGIDFGLEFDVPEIRTPESVTVIVPPERTRYLSEVAETIRNYRTHTKQQADALRNAWHLKESLTIIKNAGPSSDISSLAKRFKAEISKADNQVLPETSALLDQWTILRKAYQQDTLVYTIRDREISRPLFTESLAHTRIPKVALPAYTDPGEIFTWMRKENLPGHFPFTAGVFPLKRSDEDPTRMFAGEGNPERTNRRFRLLSGDASASRLSTAFDSATLYGFDPDLRPDIYGKVGTSGVSVCNIDDMRALYHGFDLSAPETSVSMTINGPAPIILAMFLNAAIDDKIERINGKKEQAPAINDAEKIRADVLSSIRGTVQADILKEDQGQNTCIFSIDFALKMMGDIQQYFIENRINNFYSVSISGYHIAEAGANPITQLAFTLANGFTYVEYYLSRGMPIDSFAPNLSFFFSSGMDPEYSVIGRVARRIWAIAMRDKYHASPKSTMLKYHVQTSGRSLHSREIQFNDIRTTLQALYAINDNCNSLHTNAYDEAVTTPSAESVRRSLAIQMIINRELGLANNENPTQGSFIIDTLTDLVEEAVLSEFDRITARGGVSGAMERGYQRSRIQDESLHYERLKHSGDLPIIGVNTFLNPDADVEDTIGHIELARATEDEKKEQLKRRAEFVEKNLHHAPQALERLKKTALSKGNIFAELMNTTRFCTLGQITGALYEVGGKYRRNM
ncbi:MAG: methylmalonyl-CoA mutase [Deltaproteobacteria bacterium]|nr:methylmalonyl-CoA mutase [Deltaproteobacteria bacterium]